MKHSIRRHRKRAPRGCVEHRGRHYWLRLPIETCDASTGELRRRQHRVRLGSDREIRSEVAARRVADGWIARHFTGAHSAGESIAIETYIEEFLKRNGALMRPHTCANYRSVLRVHIGRWFAGRLIGSIDTRAINEFFAELVKQKLQHSTILNIRSKLLQLMRQARRDGYDAPVVDPHEVRGPKRAQARREPRAFSAAEYERIYEASGWPWRALWACCWFIGLRISEALALRWDDFTLDLAAGVVRIRESCVLGRLWNCKTETSRRDLPIERQLVRVLLFYRQAAPRNERGLLFASQRGTPLFAANVRARVLRPLLKKLGIESGGFHAFRHGRPRVLAARGQSAGVIQKLMRHGSLAMTQRYLHTDVADLRAATEAGERRHFSAGDVGSDEPSGNSLKAHEMTSDEQNKTAQPMTNGVQSMQEVAEIQAQQE